MHHYLKYLAAVDCDWETESRNIYERIRSISATYINLSLSYEEKFNVISYHSRKDITLCNF